MEQPSPIVWKATFESNYTHEKYAVDRENITKALATLGSFDVAASPQEVAAVDAQLAQPGTPDDLTQTVAARAAALCRSGTTAPLKFRGVFKFRDPSPNEGVTMMYIRTPAATEYPEWTSVGIAWPTRITALNRIPLDKRPETAFCFQVVLGNNLQSLHWSAARWMETVVHEGLHKIELWRRGQDWPDADSEGELDHLLFRLVGYRRYSYWRNKMTPPQIDEIWPAVQEWEAKEVGRDGKGRDLVKKLYTQTAPGHHEPYRYMDCLQLASHFPAPAAPLVRDASTTPPAVDQQQSAPFLAALKGHLDKIFRYERGQLAELKPPFHWW